MEVRLHTRLITNPIPKENMSMFQLGTTPCFSFDLSEEVFDFEDIFQLTFIFKQLDNIYSYKMVEYNSNDWKLENRFEYDETLDTIRFTMTPEDTLQFVPSKLDCPDTLVDFEVVVTLIDDERELVFANREDRIYVLDSLYRNVIEV